MEEFSYLIPSGEDKVTEKLPIFSCIGSHLLNNFSRTWHLKPNCLMVRLYCFLWPPGHLSCRHSDSWTVFFAVNQCGPNGLETEFYFRPRWLWLTWVCLSQCELRRNTGSIQMKIERSREWSLRKGEELFNDKYESRLFALRSPSSCSHSLELQGVNILL